VKLICSLLFAALPAFAASSLPLCNVRDFGAAGDGRHKDTAALQAAIDSCAKGGGGTVIVPPGRYLIGSLSLRSHITLDIGPGAVLAGSEDPADYPLRDNVYGGGRKYLSSLIYADGVEDITLTGRGTIDGQGQIWWKRQWFVTPKKGTPRPQTPQDFEEAKKIANGRPHLIQIVRSKDVVIERLHLINSASWTVNPLLCEFVRIDGITIENPVPSPNTDGINPESCRNVQILNSRIDVGDDCVTLKSGTDELGRKMGRPDENITITNCVMLKGHGGVTIGSEMSGGVRNVVVSNCVFQGTDVGIRVKSQRGRGNIVEGLEASNIVMQDVRSAFTITTFYHGSDTAADVFPVDQGTPRFRDFHFSNITARGSDTAGEVTGLREMPVEDITFTDVHIRAKTGMKVNSAKGITFRNCTIDTQTGPAIQLKNSTAIDTGNLSAK